MSIIGDDDLNDSLSDLIGNTVVVGPAKAPPESYKPKAPGEFRDPCVRCGGSGRYGHLGTCFKCAGSGKGNKTFKTPYAVRAAARYQKEEREIAKKAAALETFKVEYPDVWAWMDGNNFDFAVKMMADLRKYGSLTEGKLAACRRMIAAREEKRLVREAAAKDALDRAPVVSMEKIEAAFATALAKPMTKGAEGRKPPMIRVAGYKFMSLSYGRHAGGVKVYRTSDRLPMGVISGGKFVRYRECGPDDEKAILAAAADPKAAAIAYGRDFSSCSICGRELTDAESIANGIGPICATKMGW